MAKENPALSRGPLEAAADRVGHSSRPPPTASPRDLPRLQVLRRPAVRAPRTDPPLRYVRILTLMRAFSLGIASVPLLSPPRNSFLAREAAAQTCSRTSTGSVEASSSRPPPQ
ncbi:unnamed protein product [Ixodes hexagonus]